MDYVCAVRSDDGIEPLASSGPDYLLPRRSRLLFLLGGKCLASDRLFDFGRGDRCLRLLQEPHWLDIVHHGLAIRSSPFRCPVRQLRSICGARITPGWCSCCLDVDLVCFFGCRPLYVLVSSILRWSAAQ